MKYRYATFNNNEFESHKLVYNMIEPNSKVLDIGCATGYFAKELLKKNCETCGVDIDENALKIAIRYCKKVEVSNLDEVHSFPFPKKSFDCVLLLDVIEHLAHPENILAIAKLYLKDNGSVIVSVPNIAHASIRWMLSMGEFQYADTGILDSTHLHFYTKKSLGEVLKVAGYKILKFVPTNGMCKVPFLYKITDRLPTSWQYKITCLAPTLFSFQFIAQVKVL
jgi:O-antigen biosynthesis protein